MIIVRFYLIKNEWKSSKYNNEPKMCDVTKGPYTRPIYQPNFSFLKTRQTPILSSGASYHTQLINIHETLDVFTESAISVGGNLEVA